jgi:rsbT co-antagonist protein RsbR
MVPPQEIELPAALQEASHLQAVIDTFDDLIFFKNREHRWTGCNDAFCRLLGLRREQVIGHSDADYFPPEQAEVFLQIDSQVMETGEPIANEEQITTSDGSVHTIYTRKYPLRDETDTIIGLAGIITDITGLKKRQDDLEELELTLADKAATVESQRILIEQIAVSVIQVWEGVLLLPLVGVIDTHRANRILENMLDAIARHKARVLILDITGVPLVDTSVAGYIIRSIQASQLLGCESILVGISPHIAQTLVQLGIDFGHITTRATLQQGLEYGLRQLNYVVRRRQPNR